MFTKPLSKKAITGKVFTVILTLIVAIIALVLLWTFLSKATPFISNVIENTIDGFKGALCDKLGIGLVC